VSVRLGDEMAASALPPKVRELLGAHHNLPIGSSDFHTGGHPGWCRTWVLARERSVAGVIAAVRDGRTVAVDMNGALYGSPEAIGIVTASGVSAPLPQESGTWQRLSVAAAWLGLLGLALL